MVTHPFSWLGPLALPRLTLLLNHIVSSEPLAMAKLQPHAGRTIDVQWTSSFSPALPGFLGALASPEAWIPPTLSLRITPAGLFEAAHESPAQDGSALQGLVLTVKLPDPLELAKMALSGQRPEVGIEGDVALAETAAWLMKNLRWDLQDDLARWLGDTPATLLRTLGEGVRQSLARWRPKGSADASTPR